MSERKIAIIGVVAEKPVHLEINRYLLKVVPNDSTSAVEIIAEGHRLDERVDVDMIVTVLVTKNENGQLVATSLSYNK